MAFFRLHPCVLTVLLLNFFCCLVSSLFFHIRDTEVKCFTKEIPGESQLIGNYRTQLYDQQEDRDLSAPQDLSAPLDLRILVQAKDPDGKLILSQASGSKGGFSLTSRKPGEHQICLQSSPSKPQSAGAMLAVHLDIKVNVEKDKLTKLQLSIQRLTEQVHQIHEEQKYYWVREKHFRDVSHSTNMWIFWWPVVRSLYVVAIIMWHTKSW